MHLVNIGSSNDAAGMGEIPKEGVFWSTYVDVGLNPILLTCTITVTSTYGYVQAEWKIAWVLIRLHRQKPADLDIIY